MESTVDIRKNDFIQFMKNVEHMYDIKKGYKYRYNTILKMTTNKKKIAKGIEGEVYSVNFKINEHFDKKFVIKHVDLLSIQETKDISKRELNTTPDKVYKLFMTNDVLNKPSLIEMIKFTLTNRLIFQKICPNFALNYYWEYNDNNIYLFNEYINGGNFYSWANEIHNNQEWFNALFQIMFALAVIKRKFNMIHCDLHIKNILVQKVKPGGYWIYILNGVKYYVPNLGYIFLLYDFGFSWIPNKLYIRWLYEDKLKHVTNNGMEFYDLSTFFENIFDTNAPNYFKSQIKRFFTIQEMTRILEKKYYQKKYKNAKHDKSNASFLKLEKFLEVYPETSKKYSTHKTIAGKIHDIFSKNNFETTNEFDTDELVYTTIKHNSGEFIEEYNIDTKIDKSKIPDNFKFLIRRN